MTRRKQILIAFIIMAVITAIGTPAVYADTDGTEIQITDQPGRLILQLGPQWAGVEFELKTDAGVFPAPVVVDASGILKMDLGGSKTYTLSCVMSAIAVPVPQTELNPPAPKPSADPEDTSVPESRDFNSIPTSHLIMFFGGLAAAVTGLLLMRYFKRRRDEYEYSEDEFNEAPPY